MMTQVEVMSLVFAFGGLAVCPARDLDGYETCILSEAEQVRRGITNFSTFIANIRMFSQCLDSCIESTPYHAQRIKSRINSNYCAITRPY